MGVTSLSSPFLVFCIRTFFQGLLMPHFLQEALPDTLALPACQLFGLDQVALSYTNLEGLSVHRVSGNHDNMGRFLVAMETYELVLRLAPGKAGLAIPRGAGSSSSRAHPSLGEGGSPVSPRGQAPCLPWDAHSQPLRGRVEGLKVHRLNRVEEEDQSQGLP